MLIKTATSITSIHVPITGLITAVVTDTRPGIRPKVHRIFNTINRRTVEQLLMDNTVVFNTNQRLAISTDDTDLVTNKYDLVDLPNIIAIGDPNLAGVSGYVFNPETMVFPNSATFHNRFLQPTSPRVFRSAGIVDGTTDNDLSSVTRDCYSFKAFPSDVTQGITAFVDLFYKVYIDWQNVPSNIKVQFQKELELLMFGEITIGLKYEDNNPMNFIGNPNNPDPEMITRAVYDEDLNTTYTPNIPFLKRKYTLSMPFPKNILWGGLAYGRLERNGSQLEGYKGTAGMIQVNPQSNLTFVFPHNDTSPAFWYDQNSLSTSTYKLNVTDSANITDQLPTAFMVEDVVSGLPGIGGYKVHASPFSGGKETTDWAQRPRPLTVTHKYPGVVPEDDDVYFSSRWVYEWTTSTRWVSGRGVHVAIWNFYPETTVETSWDLGTLFSVTVINDMATDWVNELIYVATEEGLYRIDPNEIPANQVTQLSSDRAKAVDVGFNGAVFAVLIDVGDVGRLASSLNVGWGDAHSFSGTIDFAKVIFIRCDRGDSDNPLCLVEFNWLPNDPAVNTGHNNQTVGKIHWWDFPNGYTGTPIDCQMRTSSVAWFHKSICFPFNSSVTVYPTEGANPAVWVFPRWFLTISNVNGASAVWRGEVVDALQAAGETIINSDLSIDTSNRTLAAKAVPGAARFNQSLRAETYNATDLLDECFPSYAILDNDISSNRLPVLCAGMYGLTTATFSYTSTRLLETGGVFDLEVSTVSNTSGDIFGYKDETEVNKYFFTRYSSGSGLESTYSLRGNVQKAKEGGFLFFMDGTISTNRDFFGGGNLHTNTHWHPFTVSFWGAPDKPSMSDPTYKGWSTTYAWNPTLNGGSGDWEVDTIGTGQSKPFHTAVEDAPQGLQFGFTDGAPALSVPTVGLVAGHYKTFVKVPGGVAIASDGSPTNESLFFTYYLRPTDTESISGTIPGSPHQINVPAASSDPDWFGLDPDGEHFDITIDGRATPATVITSGTPATNEILLVDHRLGTVEFSAADDTLAYAGDSFYGKKVDPTET